MREHLVVPIYAAEPVPVLRVVQPVVVRGAGDEEPYLADAGAESTAGAVPGGAVVEEAVQGAEAVAAAEGKGDVGGVVARVAGARVSAAFALGTGGEPAEAAGGVEEGRAAEVDLDVVAGGVEGDGVRGGGAPEAEGDFPRALAGAEEGRGPHGADVIRFKLDDEIDGGSAGLRLEAVPVCPGLPRLASSGLDPDHVLEFGGELGEESEAPPLGRDDMEGVQPTYERGQQSFRLLFLAALVQVGEVGVGVVVVGGRARGFLALGPFEFPESKMGPDGLGCVLERNCIVAREVEGDLVGAGDVLVSVVHIDELPKLQFRTLGAGTGSHHTMAGLLLLLYRLRGSWYLGRHV